MTAFNIAVPDRSVDQGEDGGAARARGQSRSPGGTRRAVCDLVLPGPRLECCRGRASPRDQAEARLLAGAHSLRVDAGRTGTLRRSGCAGASGPGARRLSLVVHHHAAWVHLLARRYDEAIAQCRSAIDMDPNFPMAHLWMGISLERQGLYDEAIASLDRAVTCMRGASIGVAAAAHAYAMSGRSEEARRRLADLQRAAPGRTSNTTASHWSPCAR